MAARAFRARLPLYAAVASAALLFAGAVAAAFIGILANGLRCDDSCPGEPPPDSVWWLDPRAAQWDTQLWLSLGALLAASVGLWLAIKRRYALAVGCAIVTVGLAFEWIAILHEAHWGGF